jgi:hypothetical protein
LVVTATAVVLFVLSPVSAGADSAIAFGMVRRLSGAEAQSLQLRDARVR